MEIGLGGWVEIKLFQGFLDGNNLEECQLLREDLIKFICGLGILRIGLEIFYHDLGSYFPYLV